jgi:hypothetical protein
MRFSAEIYSDLGKMAIYGSRATLLWDYQKWPGLLVGADYKSF